MPQGGLQEEQVLVLHARGSAAQALGHCGGIAADPGHHRPALLSGSVGGLEESAAQREAADVQLREVLLGAIQGVQGRRDDLLLLTEVDLLLRLSGADHQENPLLDVEDRGRHPALLQLLAQLPGHAGGIRPLQAVSALDLLRTHAS